MSDISKIHLPDGNDYDIVAKKVFMEGGGSVGTSYAPLLATWDNSNGNKDIIIPYNGPEVDLDTGNVRLKMGNTNISSQYTITKTSGNWSITEILAYRCGNVIQLSATFKGNGNSVSTGSNAFVGTVTYGQLPLMASKGISFIGSGAYIFQIDSAGNVYARVIGSSITLASNTTNSVSIMYIV